MKSDLADRIIAILDEQPNLTSEQLAILTNSKIDTLQKNIKRMYLRGVVSLKKLPGKDRNGRIYSWKLKEDKTKELTEQSYKHEIKCNDIYVVLKKAGIPFKWGHTSDQKNGFRFDRAMEAFGKRFYIEFETGSQGIDEVKFKVQNYIKQPGRFYVIFVVMDYQPNPDKPVKVKAINTFKSILTYLEKQERTNQFLVTFHKYVIRDSFQTRLASPLNVTYTLEEVE